MKTTFFLKNLKHKSGKREIDFLVICFSKKVIKNLHLNALRSERRCWHLTLPKESANESRVGFFLDKTDKGVAKSFRRLHYEILKDGHLTKKEKLVIAVASAVAAKCEICVKALTKEALKKIQSEKLKKIILLIRFVMLFEKA